MPLNIQLISRFRELIPKLSSDLHKGQSGRVAIIGGSREYTGAPYFSAISALRAGADIAYVLTIQDASSVIKTFSPDMIVLPVLDSECNELDMRTWIGKTHSLIIGPGLGRSENAFNCLKIALNAAKSRNIPIVIDADGLFILSYDTSLVDGYKKCILTPNFMEFKRLYEETFKDEDEYDETKQFKSVELQCEAVKKLANRLNNLTIVKKGKVDIITDGNHVLTNDLEGSLKRCGGIGDLLTGTIGTFTYWTHSGLEKQESAESADSSPPLNQPCLLAAYAATTFIKECSRKAFEKKHRSTLADDIIKEIPEQFYNLFDKS